MIWSAMLLAVVLAAGAAACLGFAVAGEVYGYPAGRKLVQRVDRRRDERRFFPADIREIDEAFRRVIREVTPG